MDQCGDWRRAFHRVRKPDIQRNLSRFSGGPENKQKRNCGKYSAMPLRIYANGLKDMREIKRTELANDEKLKEPKEENGKEAEEERDEDYESSVRTVKECKRPQ